MAKKVKKPSIAKFLTIEWPVDPGAAQFANNIVVQSDERTLYLSFFQLNPPMIMGSQAERKQQLDAMSSIEPRLISRIALPLDQMEKLDEAMKEHLVKRAKRRASEESNGSE